MRSELHGEDRRQAIQRQRQKQQSIASLWSITNNTEPGNKMQIHEIFLVTKRGQEQGSVNQRVKI